MDINKTKHKNIYAEEFDLAKKILAEEPGIIEWSHNEYQAFTYKSDRVCLVFYPHKTSAGNYHVRVRDQGSKDKRLANLLMCKLNNSSGYNCTFTRKAS